MFNTYWLKFWISIKHMIMMLEILQTGVTENVSTYIENCYDNIVI